MADSEELIMNGDKPFEVKVRGTLTVRMDGRAITKTQYGCQPIEMKRDGTAPVSIGDAYKGAATDAMKKCASLLGIALDLYDSDYKPEKYAEPEPIRAVKLEGPQPTDAPYLTSAHLDSLGPRTRQLLEWLAKMQWDANDLANYIYHQFKLAVDEGDAVKAIEALDGAQKKALYQMVEAEYKARQGGK